MRRASAALAAAFIALVLPRSSAAQSAARPAPRPNSTRATTSSNGSTAIATSPRPSTLPAAVQALSKAGALREPETAGFFVGFVAGVLGANPARAEALADRMLPLPAADQWFVVRAIAYSGLPAWKQLLRSSPTGCRRAGP